MKKTNILKIFMTLVLAFAISGAFAQTNGGAGVANAANVTFETGAFTMVEGTTIPLYAKPDTVYHPLWYYDTQTWTLTAGFTWNWSADVPAAFSFSPAASNIGDNYVAITAEDGSAGNTYTISVTEEAPAAYGGCEGAPQTLSLTVVDTVSATLGALAGTSPNYCATDATIPTAVPLTIADGVADYHVTWSLEIATLSGAPLAKDEYWDTDKATLGTTQAYVVNYTEASPDVKAASFDLIDEIADGAFTVVNNKPTLYTFTVTSINGQALRFGDYITLSGVDSDLSAFSDIPVGETFTIQINPAPVTGPIYHIPSTWAN